MRVNSSRLAGDPAKKNFLGHIGIISKVVKKNFENRSDRFLPAITVPRVALKRVEPAGGGGGGGGRGATPLFPGVSYRSNSKEIRAQRPERSGLPVA